MMITIIIIMTTIITIPIIIIAIMMIISITLKLHEIRVCTAHYKQDV